MNSPIEPTAGLTGPALERVRAAAARWRDGHLEIPSPWSAESAALLAARVGDWRGRRLHVAPASRYGWSGHLVVVGAHVDMLIYDDSTTGLYGRHGFLHELGHLVLDHHGVDLDPAATAEVTRELAARIGYASQEEREAELWATLVGLDAV